MSDVAAYRVLPGLSRPIFKNLGFLGLFKKTKKLKSQVFRFFRFFDFQVRMFTFHVKLCKFI